MRRWRRPSACATDAAALAVAVVLAIAGAPSPAGAADALDLGGDVRVYQFLRLDDAGDARRDAELGIGRLKMEATRGETLGAEAHGVFSLLSPGGTRAGSVVTGTTRRFFELQHTFESGDDASMTLEADRLNVRWERRPVRLVAGRQAITWGVNYFWPTLDLFAPFAPERIDREYKPGVDAVRATVALGTLSNVDVVGAALGTSVERDGALAALARINVGPADVGFMLGHVHGDTVAGGFVTASVLGTGLRGEVAFTESGDAADAGIGRGEFWRAGVGLDRQLTETVALIAELAWNGFGTSRPADYPRIARADRVRRGEVNALGRAYAGASLTWQAHPLLALVGTILVNLGDGSALLLPHGEWSLSDNASVVFGGVFGAGAGLRDDGAPGSEYGSAGQTVYGAIKLYF
jgi:hypothetical protein